MRIYRSRFYQQGLSLLFLVCLCCLGLFCSAQTAFAEATIKTIRVGFCEGAYFQVDAHGNRRGYCYDYIIDVATQAGWKCEFIDKSWQELLTMLERGEIDILGDVTWTPERQHKYLFSAKPMGQEAIYIFVNTKSNKYDSNDLSTLQGAKIGVLSSSTQSKFLSHWAQKHNINLQLQEIATDKELIALLSAGHIDGIVAENYYNWKICHPLVKISTTPIYFALNPKRPELKQELDVAQSKLLAGNPFYQQELEKKYFQTAVTSSLDKKSLAFLKDHGPIKIGYLNNEMSFCGTHPNGSVAGVLSNYILVATERFYNGKLQFKATPYTNYTALLEDLKTGKLDVIFPFYGERNLATTNDVIMSNPLFTSLLVATTDNNDFNEHSKNIIAVDKSNHLNLQILQILYPSWRLRPYATSQECETALSRGEVDAIVYSIYQISHKLSPDHSFRLFPLSGTMEVCFALRRDELPLLTILNQSIALIPETDVYVELASATMNNKAGTIRNFIRTYHIHLMGCGVVILALLMTLLYRSQQARKRALESELQLSKLNAQLLANKEELESALCAAKEADHAKSIFLSNMSHDIRTPLNAIIGFTTLAITHITEQHLVLDYLGKIGTSSQHLLSLLNDVLDMSRLGKEQVSLEKAPLSWQALLRSITSMVQPELAPRSLTLTVETKNLTHDWICSDKVLLARAILNIVNNAVRFNKKGGSVAITLTQTTAEANMATFCLSVRDTGIGMSQEFLSHIFEAFTREQTSTISGVSGSGLGLSITKAIITALGGTISATSEIGKGSEFIITLTLPLATAPATESEQTSEASTATDFTGTKVLVVEDNLLNQEIAKSLLEELGFSVAIASDGDIALSMLQEDHAYALIFMDIQMPRLNGYATTKAIRALPDAWAKAIPIIAMTANTAPQDRQRAKEVGMNGFIPKPVDIGQMLEEISRILS